MPHHRGDRRAPRRAARSTSHDPTYVGRRVARPEPVEPVVTAVVSAEVQVPTPTVVDHPLVRETPVTSVVTPLAVHAFASDVTAELPLVSAPVPPAGKRKAVKHAGARGPLFRGLPSPPLLVGVTVLALAVGGAITSAESPAEISADDTVRAFAPVSAMTGSTGSGRVTAVSSDRNRPVSRDSSRQALAEAADADLVAEAEKQAKQRDAALGQLAAAAETQAAKLALNQWVLPLRPSITTATFGQVGLWASSHTGLDFNGETGDPIYNVAAGTVTSTGYDGSYGNKTVVTLEDGTEIWYCHQTSINVSPGDTVRADEVIGTVGSTGNSTGSHLHVEVRPGGGDPVDPYAAFVVHGVTP